MVLDLFSPVESSSGQEITGRLIYEAIRGSFQDLYGDFGIAQLGTFGGMLSFIDLSSLFDFFIFARGAQPIYIIHIFIHTHIYICICIYKIHFCRGAQR